MSDDMNFEKWASIPTLFQRGADKLVLPTINPLCAWVLNTDAGLMTIKIDGVLVKVTLESSTWCIYKRMSETAFMKTNQDDPLDAPLWEAFHAQDVKTNGIFEVYGKTIKNNPYKIDKHFMIKVFPVDYTLIISKYTTKIKRGWGVPVGELFDEIRAELASSPEVEGLVFHLEEASGLALKGAAKVKRTDFGLPWPAPVADIRDMVVVD